MKQFLKCSVVILFVLLWVVGVTACNSKSSVSQLSTSSAQGASIAESENTTSSNQNENIAASLQYYDSAKTIPAYDSSCGQAYEDGFESFMYSGYLYGSNTATSSNLSKYDSTMSSNGFSKVDMSEANSAMGEIFNAFGIGDEMKDFKVNRCYQKASGFLGTFVYVYSDASTRDTLVVVMAL